LLFCFLFCLCCDAAEEAAHQKLQDSTAYQQLRWLQLDKQELQERIKNLQESNGSLWAQCKGDYERVASRKKHIACDSCTQVCLNKFKFARGQG
jgi:hypothetical protein